MNNISCKVCDTKEYRLLYKKEDYNIMICLQCGFCWVYPQPSDEKLEKRYNEDYNEIWLITKDNSSVQIMKKKTFEKRLKKIQEFKNSGRILDIGCATGMFLELASEKGWESYGLDVGEYAIELAKKKFGNNIYKGTLEQAKYDNDYFDVITMFDVIEHMRNPSDSLRETNRILKKDGLLVITTPNITSFACKFYGKNWPYFDLEHLYYFSPDTLKRMLNSSGFEVSEIAPTRKALNMLYINTYFNITKRPVFKFISNTLMKFIPEALANKTFFISTGEIITIARKTEDL